MIKISKNKKDIFAYNLLYLRKINNLNQYDLAKMLNIGRSTISLYETGEKKPSYRVLKDIATSFGVSINWLMGLPEGREYKSS